MQTNIQKWGNSLGVRIPNVYAKELNISDGSSVELQKTADGILIKPDKQKKALKDLLKLITDENRHEEVSFGKPQGREEW